MKIAVTGAGAMWCVFGACDEDIVINDREVNPDQKEIYKYIRRIFNESTNNYFRKCHYHG